MARSHFVRLVGQVATAVLVVLSGSIPVAGAPSAAASLQPGQISYAGNPQFGANFITAPDALADSARYARAQQTGAGWDRWPLYWWQVSPGGCNNFTWNAGGYNVDQAVTDDTAHNFAIDAILLQTAPCAQSAVRNDVPAPRVGQHELSLPGEGRSAGPSQPSSTVSPPANLDQGVFLNGSTPTDDPGNWTLPINPNNYWAMFVNAAVNRYKPGGILAQQQGWAPGRGVTVWEMWNEPDFCIQGGLCMWSGSAQQYARLLMVGYLAAKRADQGAQVMFGGLSNAFPDGTGHYPYLGNVLAAMQQSYPSAPSYGYYFDILAIHNYSWAWNTWFITWTDTNTLGSYGLSKPIWVNESGVPVWDQYPGPTWAPTAQYFASASEAASFDIQSAALSRFAGADVVFHFQLNDDCGNEPAGTDFPDGTPQQRQQWCDAHPGQQCWGSAYGLYENGPGYACYTQSFTPWAARPAVSSFQVLTSLLPYSMPGYRYRSPDAKEERVVYTDTVNSNRIIFDWDRYATPTVATIPALSSSATLIDQSNNRQTIYPVNGAYTLNLAGATNFNTPTCTPFVCDGAAPIGGLPWILVEQIIWQPPPTATATATRTPAPTSTPTPTPYLPFKWYLPYFPRS